MKSANPTALVILGLAAWIACALTACQTLFTASVGLTRVVEDASRDYAKMYLAGLVPLDLAVKASLAHAEYRKAAGVLADALESVKAGKAGDTKAALEGARTAANNFVDVLFGILGKQRVTELRAQIAKAGGP